MTFGSLFAGIGGFDLGFERAGMRCVWQVEIDPYCRRVLAKHWPDVPKWDDVKTFTGEGFERPDVICGGFPCQPTARCGYQRRQSDDRWLWPEYARIVRHFRPRYVVVENPTGLFDGGIGDVLGDLAACGYDAEWDCIPARTAGTPHSRDRLWLVGYPNNFGQQGKIYPRKLRQTSQGHADDPAFGSVRFTWPPGPLAVADIPRMVDGTANRMDRLKGLGNAVVPQVAEWIGRRLLTAGNLP